MSVRDLLLAQPFVCETETGLDLWCPPPNPHERRETALARGRLYAASFLHAVEDLDDISGLFYHLASAVRGKAPGCAVALGFLSEVGATVRQAPRQAAPEMVFASRLRFTGEPAHDLPLLPWGEPCECEYDEAIGRGRFYGAVLAELLRQTGWAHILSVLPALAREPEPVFTGVCHTIARLIHAAPPDATWARRAVKEMAREDSFPA